MTGQGSGAASVRVLVVLTSVLVACCVVVAGSYALDVVNFRAAQVDKVVQAQRERDRSAVVERQQQAEAQREQRAELERLEKLGVTPDMGNGDYAELDPVGSGQFAYEEVCDGDGVLIPAFEYLRDDYCTL